MTQKLYLLLCLFSCSVYGNSLIEAKVGYFFFNDSKMSDVYKDGGIDVQISAAGPVYSVLNLYGSVEYLKRSGHSLNGHQPTTIWEVPLSFGLQPIFKITSAIDYYFTLGPRYIFAHVHNDSSYVQREMNARNFGGFVNTGFIFRAGHFAIDLFGEYSYAKLSFHSSKNNSEGHTAQVGGFTFGGGLGYAF